MNTLTRVALSDKLETFLHDGRVEPLAAWAFDQFYAEEEGTLQYEPGYRRIIAEVLDDVMFGDAVAFGLERSHAESLLARLQAATPQADDELDDEDAEDEELDDVQ